MARCASNLGERCVSVVLAPFGRLRLALLLAMLGADSVPALVLVLTFRSRLRPFLHNPPRLQRIKPSELINTLKGQYKDGEAVTSSNAIYLVLIRMGIFLRLVVRVDAVAVIASLQIWTPSFSEHT